MGGRFPKPAAQRQRRNKRNEVGLVTPRSDGEEIPETDPGWLPDTEAEWAAYWNSDVSGLVNIAGDLSAVRRLFNYRDEYSRTLARHRKTGDLLPSLMKLEKMILPLEDRYGLSAQARLRLGAELGGATKSLAEMNASLASAVVTGGSDGSDEDESASVVRLPGLPQQTE